MQTSSRIGVVDALRGFAVVAIMLLHNIEHFDLYYTPTGLPAWMVALDKVIWDSGFFLFGGKAYAIFALLFGLTFYLQLHRREQKGEDFRPRFAWRMVLLLGFGLFNTLFYEGDILSIYAMVGLLLIPVARLGNGAVLAIATLLMLQPLDWIALFSALPNPALKLADPASWAYFGKANVYLASGSMSEVWIGNLTNGKIAAVRWSWENGRLFQMLALFMFGMLAGRKGLFESTDANLRFWKRVLVAAALSFTVFYIVKNGLDGWIAAEGLRRPLSTIVTSWNNVAFMLVLVSSFVLLYQRGTLLRIFAPLGRMSLTSYVVQSMVGVAIYYGYGLGLYKFTGATYCLLIGIVLAVLQGLFSAWWLRRHEQGPLEALWHRATWIGKPRAAVAVS